MKSLALFALTLGAVLLFAGCGGSQPPIGAPGAMALGMTSAQRMHVRPAYSVLYSFEGGLGDGENPWAGLVNVKGTLYGTTYDGDGYGCYYYNGCGTVYSSSPSGTETVLHNFDGAGDGEYPHACLVNVKGTLYGTTEEGGANGYGTVFSITPSGAETVLYSFKGGSTGDGYYPYAGLVNVKGTLYGTTNQGGAYYGNGTVFSITPSGMETVLHSFGGSGDGAQPYAGLVSVNGTLYGTTVVGGANGDGTVFSIARSGAETVLHSFGSPGDGIEPIAGLLNVEGTLYGTTGLGGASDGTVFSITRSGKETVLYNFTGGPTDGGNPYAGLINVNGMLYGTTYKGGAKGDGTVFSITRSGKETVLYNFTGGSADGGNPYAGLINVDGMLYGTTVYGGAHRRGTVFSLSP